LQDRGKERAQGAVNGRLQSIVGAQFREAATDTDIIGAYVDSENGFGAMIRWDWICSASFTPGSTDVEAATVISISSY
jgi:hypothetical protein